MKEIMGVAETSALENQEKCTKLYAAIAEKNVKSHLYLPREDRYTAGNACPNTGNPGTNFFIYSKFPN